MILLGREDIKKEIMRPIGVKDLVLGIETSCDETSVAVVDDQLNILSNVIFSQIDIHKEFGGVVPEIASRNHVEVIDRVTKLALIKAGVEVENITMVAATTKPGLPGAVLVGSVFGRSIAASLGVLFKEVHHILGHVASVPVAFANKNPEDCLSLVISGGHTALYKVEWDRGVTLLEQTADDAVGEAFDKVARILGLEYPGGPIIEKLASQCQSDLINFVSNPNYSKERFSYSGLKTAVLNYVNRQRQKGTELDIPKIAASFQQEAIAQLVYKTVAMLKKTGMKTLHISGGVSINKFLRDQFKNACNRIGVEVYFPTPNLCGDNAAMIAGAALLFARAGCL